MDALIKIQQELKAPTADKTAIKKAIEAGETVTGAELVEGTSCSIK